MVSIRTWVRLFDLQTTVACLLVSTLHSYHHYPVHIETDSLQVGVVLRSWECYCLDGPEAS